MKPAQLTPVILWTGEDEYITAAEHIRAGRIDEKILPLLKTTAVYRDLLLRDPEAMELADPNQTALVERGYRCLTNRLMEIEEPIKAMMTIAQIQIAIRQ
jgi:hypothetical protein